jgi:chromosome segregation ATPase
MTAIPARAAHLQNGTVAGTHAELVSLATELERRDAATARELDALAAVADRAGVLRARVAEVRAALARLPDELEELGRRAESARTEAESARDDLARAVERVEALARARRRKQDELDRAEREAATARQLLVDAESEVVRVREQLEALRASEPELRREGATLAHDAQEIATELARLPRIPDSDGLEPGESLEELEEWGLLVRSALLVSRGTLEAERERIVAEANELAAGVLGGSLGASSVTTVRRRLEQIA